MEALLQAGAEFKSGSIQEFVKSIGPIENFSSDLFSVDEIHKIAVLDLRLLNLDRNACNILVQKILFFNNIDVLVIFFCIIFYRN